MRLAERGFTLAEVLISLLLLSVGILTVLGLAQQALGSGHKSARLGEARLVAQSELAQAVQQARRDPAGLSASDSPSVAWKWGTARMGADDFRYAIYAQTVDAGLPALNNQLKKLDIVVQWEAHAGEGTTRLTQSQVLDED